MTETGKATDLVHQLKKRQAANAKKPRVNNMKLHAGSPMYYYCKGCGAEEILPEAHICAPKPFCDDCAPLREKGLLDSSGNLLD